MARSTSARTASAPMAMRPLAGARPQRTAGNGGSRRADPVRPRPPHLSPDTYGEEAGARSGLVLGDGWAGGQIVARAGAALRAGTPRQRARERVVLGVHRDDTLQARGLRHALVERQVVGGGEILDTAVGHESLEAGDTTLGQLL